MAFLIMNKRKRENWQGMNWCRPQTRLAIYLRDDMTCVWCLQSVEQGARLTLDHLIQPAKGGDNSPTNLVTACATCNVQRKQKGIREFARWLAYKHHIDPFAERVAHTTIRRVRNAKRRALPREPAREMLRGTGCLSNVLRGLYGMRTSEQESCYGTSCFRDRVSG